MPSLHRFHESLPDSIWRQADLFVVAAADALLVVVAVARVLALS